MKRIKSRVITILIILLVCFAGTLAAQNTRQRVTSNNCGTAPGLTGVYRIDVDQSDKLYSVIEGASSNIPYGEQQQFFMDLAVRLTPPDLLAIECRGSRVTLGSSRSPRVAFQADGVARAVRASDGRIVRSRIGIERNSLIFASSGKSDDNLSFTFTPLENGRRLRVTRRISAAELIEPVVIQTVYNKISEAVQWDIYGESQIARQTVNQDLRNSSPVVSSGARTAGGESSEAGAIRRALDQWIEATNARDIEKQMSFYLPQLKAFYLARNAARNSVRIEKTRIFARAKSINIRAEEPEIIFQDGGRLAIMRFRKKYRINTGAKSRQGEVIQELRWQRTTAGWRIFSERDIKVIS